MKKAAYMPRADDARTTWFHNYTSKIGAYAGTVGLTPADVAALIADYNFWAFVVDSKNQWTQFQQTWTAFKNALRDGEPLGPLPATPGFPPAPPLVDTGIFPRVADIVARIKRHPGYTEAIGQDLDIIGSADAFDPVNAKPKLTGTARPDGVVQLDFSKEGSDGVNLYGQRDGETTFTFLARDTASPYVDNRPLVVPGKPEVRRYRCRYIHDDVEIGVPSDEVVVTAQPY